MKRLKKFFILFILTSFVFCQNVSFVYAESSFLSSSDSEKENPVGFNNWPINDKIAWWVNNTGFLFCSFFKIGNVSSVEEYLTRLFDTSDYTKGYANYADFVAGNSSYDDDTMTWTFSDDVMAFFNEVLAALKNDITYQYGFFPSVDNLAPGSFENRHAYLCFKNVIESNPTKCFDLVPGVVTIPPSISGDRENRDITVGCKIISAYDIPYAGVCGYSLENGRTVPVYTDNWSRNEEYIKFYILDSGHYNFIVYESESGMETVLYNQVSEWDLNECIEKDNYPFMPNLRSSPVMFGDIVADGYNRYSFTSSTASIPVFKTEAEMKKGTESGTLGQYMPGYTGQPITNNTISQKEINDFSTNYNYYYGSGGSGSGSGSGSDSSGGWLDNLLSGLGKLGDIIMTLLSKIFDIITDILKFFTDTLADALDIIPTGFVSFLGALFPFIPDEWITAVSLMLAVMLIGTVIKIFRK